jgi:dTDP-4-amino-4,6-dideoxy-D-galactose acyltransferase
MAAAEPCQELPWDSEFFGVRIARATRSHADAADCEAMRRWCVERHVACLYFLCSGDDAGTRGALERAGFRFVGSRVTLERPLEAGLPAPGSPMRAGSADDIPRLRAIAAAAHHDTRFYVDGHFDAQRCDELYATWIEKSVRGYADLVIVADRGGVLAGYVTAHLPETEGAAARIGLIAVAAESRNQGVGRDLLRAAFHAAATRGVTRMSVATAGTNAAALAVYTNEGFRPIAESLWYHRWFSDAAP